MSGYGRIFSDPAHFRSPIAHVSEGCGQVHSVP